MATDGSGGSVVAAIGGNFVIAVLKLIAFFVSGSGAMLAEGIHSIADTANQALLWLGIRRSQRPADESHPYGYGAERYVWALISAMGIFFLGCGVTVYHGVHQLLHPEPTDVGWLTWSVLALSALVEGGVLMLAVREANALRRGRGWIEYLRGTSDPTVIAVLFEDSVAVFGVFVAAAGIGLSRATGILAFDGIASIIIGALLGVLALALASKNKALLVGQRASDEVEEKITQLLERDPSIEKIVGLRTRVIAAHAHRVDLQVDFDASALVARLEPEVRAAADKAQTEDGLVEFSQEFGRRLIDELALEVDRIEQAIRDEVPSARLIDVEGD
jgi:zinc transporter 9